MWPFDFDLFLIIHYIYAYQTKMYKYVNLLNIICDIQYLKYYYKIWHAKLYIVCSSCYIENHTHFLSYYKTIKHQLEIFDIFKENNLLQYILLFFTKARLTAKSVGNQALLTQFRFVCGAFISQRDCWHGWHLGYEGRWCLCRQSFLVSYAAGVWHLMSD